MDSRQEPLSRDSELDVLTPCRQAAIGDLISLSQPAAPLDETGGRLAGTGARLGRLALRLAAPGLLAAFIGAGVWLGIGQPRARYLVYAAWVVPLVELCLLGLGQLHFRLRFRRAAPGMFSRLIIQITTTGMERARVNEIIEQVRGYGLAMDHEVWVVTECGGRDDYPLADLVLAVPASFTSQSQRKARALEYSRRVREAAGLSRAEVKILFNDDDVSLTKGYIEAAFAADYDICQGIVAPRTEYATHPLGHVIASHADDIRTHGCLVYCSVFQGIIGRPLHVHGEGLAVTGAAERAVTWDWPAFASEDLVFGQRAAEAGLKWGWFHEYAELTSPWSIRDFITQRGRWLWGDIHGILHRDVLSTGAALLVSLKYLGGIASLVFSGCGLYLRATGQIPAGTPVITAAKLSALAWVAVHFACGWIGGGSRAAARTDDSRLFNAVAAVLMIPVSLVLTFAGVVIPLLQGNPRTFKVISKTRGTP